MALPGSPAGDQPRGGGEDDPGRPGAELHHIRHAVFARKNYHYADLPKGYQISQYELPFCRDGWIEVEVKAEAQVEAEIKRIGITRAHLEEDTGKLTHTVAGIAAPDSAKVEALPPWSI